MRVGIVGASGYTGAELVRLVAAHPKLSLEYVGGRDAAGKRLGDVLPSTDGVSGLGDRTIEAFEPSDAQKLETRIDVAFTALPHGASAAAGKALLDAGIRVVDLSADFRLRDAATYGEWYGEHPAPELLGRAVYGLVELHRDELADARLIAAPGCYPTGSILALAPLLQSDLVETDSIIIDAKSGVSGAGRAPTASTHLPETAEGLRPYKVAGTHRHIPEIEQELSRIAKRELKVVFTPHLAPMSRGILTAAYVRAKSKTTVESCRAAANALYSGGLVTVLADGKLPDTLWVRGSARAHIAYTLDRRTGVVVALSAIDNLARGASAQAIQALNASMRWPDSLGLPEVGLFP